MSERRYHYTVTEARVRPIIDANRRPSLGGMAGGLSLFIGGTRPETFKRLAAETLVRIPRNRETLIAWGCNPRPATLLLLERAGRLRREALRLSLLERVVDAE